MRRLGAVVAALLVLVASVVVAPPVVAGASEGAAGSSGGGSTGGVVADAGVDQSVVEGSTVSLSGSASVTGNVGAPGGSGSEGVGGQLYSTGGPVQVKILPASTAITSDLWLFDPEPASMLGTNRETGKVIDLGSFPAGSELVFGIAYQDGSTRREFKMGPADRNFDNTFHDRVTQVSPGVFDVGFEDLPGGGDRDYNDCNFEFTGGVTAIPALSYKWETVSSDGPPVQLSSSASATPSFTAFDDGTYTFRLTATAGAWSASDDVTVRVGNAPPVVTSVGVDPTATDGLAQVAVSLSDPGAFDRHSLDVDWGDGSQSVGVPVSVDGTGWGYGTAGHVYASNGSFTVSVVAHDSDGGVSAPVTKVVDVGGAGVGEVTAGASVWATSSDDKALWVSGSRNSFEGLTNSNGGIKVTGSHHEFTGGTQFVSQMSVAGSSTVVDPAASQVTASGFPYVFDVADYEPGGPGAVAAGSAYFPIEAASCSHGSWSPDEPLVSGLYWVPCDVQISGSDVAGQVTIVATGKIHVAGSSAQLTPFVDGLLFLSTSVDDHAIDLSGSSESFGGALFAPNGGVQLSGHDDSLACGVLAETVRVSGSDNTVGGAACGVGSGVASSVPIAASPLLVPKLSLGLGTDVSSVAPGATVHTTSTVGNNSGGMLFVPVELALETQGATPATLNGVTYAFQVHDPVTDTWSTLASTDPSAPADQHIVGLSTKANPATGVMYPGGADDLSGTTLAAGSFGSWAGLASISLSDEQLQSLVDPTKVDAVRNVVNFDVTGSMVRRIARFSADPLSELRAGLAGTISDVAVHGVAGGSDPTDVDLSTVPGLASISPGGHVVVPGSFAAPVAPAKGEGESDDSYVARLSALDGSKIFGSAYATGTASPGVIYAPQQIAGVTVQLPVLSAKLSAPATLNPGDDIDWKVSVTNTGSVPASGVNGVVSVEDTPVTVSGLPALIAPGQTVTATATTATTAGVTTSVDGALNVTWSDANANNYGPVGNSVAVSVRPGYALIVEKTASSAGLPPGQLGYTVDVVNSGGNTLTRVSLDDVVDANTTIIPGSVTTSAGTVTSGNYTGSTNVGVDFGDLASGVHVTVTFLVDVAQVPAAVTHVSNQARVRSDQTGWVLSDDPLVPGVADPTVTPISPGGFVGGGTGGVSLPGPTVTGCDPADGATISAPTTLHCTLVPQTGTSVAGWSATATPAGRDASETVSVGSGTGGQVSVLFDPTVLANGQWILHVSATGSDGGVSTSNEIVVVDGRLKLGRIRVTYTDMSVPVAGIPIDVTRTYDSLDRHHQGDFGQGWSLGIANFDVQTGRKLGDGGWSSTQCGSIIGAPINCVSTVTNHVVTVTWPSGRVESFKLTPKVSPPAFSFMNQAAYTPIGDATSTLAPVAADAFVMFAGGDDLLVPLSDQVYDPQRFVLTDTHGVKYLLDVSSGLVSATTLDGKTVTVSADGISSSEGPSISFTRDTLGRITRITGPSGEYRRYLYSPSGNLAHFVHGTDGTVEYEYGNDHLLTAVPPGADSPAQVFHFGFDGRVDWIGDRSGHISTVSFDLGAKTRQVTSPSGDQVTVTSFSDRGDPVEVQSVAGGVIATTTSTFNDAGQPLSVIDPDGHTTSFTYDVKGNQTSVTDGAGVVTATDYNALSEPTVTKVGGETVETKGYDGQGHLVSDAKQGQPATTYTWVDGRVVAVTSPTGEITSLGYNVAGFLDQISSAAGTVGRVTDGSGRVQSIMSPSGVSTSFGYDGDGRLVSLTGGDGVAQTWGYDLVGHVTRATDKTGASTTFRYDGTGDLISKTDRNNQLTTYSYDRDDQLASISAPDATTSIVRDGFGHPTSMTNGAASVVMAWTPGSRLQTETTHYLGATIPDQTVTYGFDGAGKATSITGQGSTTSFAYDSQGRLSTVDDSVAGEFGYGYDPTTGMIASLSRPNGVTDRFSFDDDGRLTKRDATDSLDQVLSQAEYAYNTAGLRSSLTDLAGQHDYTYDIDGRLTGVDNPTGGLPDEAFTYDRVGNMTSWNANPSSEVVYNQADQLTQDAGFTYGYDAEGNQTTVTDRATGDVTSYTWNTNHQLTKITNPDSTTVVYGYDPLGRRITTTNNGVTTYAVWAGANQRATLDANGNVTARMVTNPNSLSDVLAVTSSGTTIYPLVDGLGSTTATSNPAGTITSTTAYSAYGIPTITSGSDPLNGTAGYTGYQQDPTGLDYARARYYNPSTGRFLSQDPITAVNPYAYVSGDPTNYTDPTGQIDIGVEADLDSRAIPTAEELTKSVSTELEIPYGPSKKGIGWVMRSSDLEGREFEIRIMKESGNRTNYYRISREKIGSLDRLGNPSNDRAVTHIPIEAESLSHIIDVVSIFLG